MKYIDQICLDRTGYWRKSVWKICLGKKGEYPYYGKFLGWFSNKEGFKPYKGSNPYTTGFPSLTSLKRRVRLTTNKERTTIELAHY